MNAFGLFRKPRRLAYQSAGSNGAPGAPPWPGTLAPDPDDIRAARRLHSLARDERDAGRLERAESLAQRALENLENYASTSHPEATAVLSTLIGIRERRTAASGA